MRFEKFLEGNNRFDLSADAFLVERFAVLELSQVPAHAHNEDLRLRQFPKLIFFQIVGAFRRVVTSHKSKKVQLSRLDEEAG